MKGFSQYTAAAASLTWRMTLQSGTMTPLEPTISCRKQGQAGRRWCWLVQVQQHVHEHGPGRVMYHLKYIIIIVEIMARIRLGPGGTF